MGYHDILFPEDASYGTRSSPAWSTSIIKVDSGAEERVAKWATPHYRFHVAYKDKTRDNSYLLDAFFAARNGAENSFKFKDWRDHASTANGRVPTATDPSTPVVTDEDQLIGIGDDDTTDFQLVKRYEDAAASQIRQIVKPKSGTVLVAIDGAAQTEGVDFTVNLQTGVITFASAPTAGEEITAGFEFYVVTRLGDAQDKGGLGGSFDDHDRVDYPEVELVEDPTTYLLREDIQYGGDFAQSFGADITLSFLNGRVQVLTPTGGGISAKLPDATFMPRGGPIAWLFNPSANTLAIKHFDGSSLFALPAASGGVDGSVTLLLAEVSGTATWKWT